MGTEAIFNYRRVDDALITGGQPTEEQLRAAAEEGVKMVINLAPTTPSYSLEDEAGLVDELGMSYHYIPVDWAQPTEADFAAFEAAMAERGEEKTLIHCMANFRVTAFYTLYAMKHLGWSEAQADELRASIWAGSDYPVWESFIQEMKGKLGA